MLHPWVEQKYHLSDRPNWSGAEVFHGITDCSNLDLQKDIVLKRGYAPQKNLMNKWIVFQRGKAQWIVPGPWLQNYVSTMSVL